MSSPEFGARRNLLKNSLGIFVSRVLTTFVSFISIPIVVNKLGIAGYGTWESIIAVSFLTNMFQGTISGTLLWMVSNAHGSNDIESVRKYLRMGVFLSLVLFLIITPASWFGRFFLIDLFKVPSEFAVTAAWILPCIVGLMLLGSISEILGAVIGGFQRSGATTLTLAVATTANNVLVIICLMLGLGFWSLLIGFAVGFLISTIGLYIVALRVVGPLSLLPQLPSRSVLVKVAPYAGFMLLGALSLALRDQTDKIILSSVASPAWTGFYGIAARLSGLVLIICTFFYVPTIAASGALYSNNDQEGIYKLYDDVITMMSFLVGLFVVLIAGLYDRLVVLWIGKPIPEVGLILYLLLIGYTMAVLLTGAGSSVCKGMGIVRIETIYIVIGLILNIGLKIILVPLIGAMGTLASSAISWAVSSIIFVILLHKYTRVPTSATLKAVKTLFVIVACVSTARWISEIYPIEAGRLPVLISSTVLGISLSLLFTLLMIISKALPVKVLDQCGHFVRTRITNRFAKS